MTIEGKADTTVVEEVVTTEDLNVEVEDQDSETDENVETDEESTEDVDSEQQEEDGEEDGEDDGSDEKLPTKLTAEERKAQLQKEIQDLANQRRALKESLEQELMQKVQEELQKNKEETPPYVEVDWEKFNAHIAAELEVIDNLKFEGRAAEALLKQRNLEKLYDQVEENERLKTEWEKQQEAKRYHTESTNQINQAIVQASELVRKAMNVEEGDWKLGEQWFLEKRRVDPLLDTQYREMVYTQGPTHALKWAYDYVVSNMGKQAKEAKEKREEGKKKVVGGSSSTAVSDKVPTSFDELMKLPQDKIVKLEKSNPKLFNKLLNQKLK